MEFLQKLGEVSLLLIAIASGVLLVFPILPMAFYGDLSRLGKTIATLLLIVLLFSTAGAITLSS